MEIYTEEQLEEAEKEKELLMREDNFKEASDLAESIARYWQRRSDVSAGDLAKTIGDNNGLSKSTTPLNGEGEK